MLLKCGCASAPEGGDCHTKIMSSGHLQDGTSWLHGISNFARGRRGPGNKYVPFSCHLNQPLFLECPFLLSDVPTPWVAPIISSPPRWRWLILGRGPMHRCYRIMCRCWFFTTSWTWCLLDGKLGNMVISMGWLRWDGWGIWNFILTMVSDMERLMYG